MSTPPPPASSFPQAQSPRVAATTSSSSSTTPPIPRLDLSAIAAVRDPQQQQQHTLSSVMPPSQLHPPHTSAFTLPMTTAFDTKRTPLLLPRILLPLRYIRGDNATHHPSPPGSAEWRSPTEPYTPQPHPHVRDASDSTSNSAQPLLARLQPIQPKGASRKRSLSSGDDDDDASSPERKRTKPCSRKPTYLVRKEEKHQLLAQVQQLQAHVDYLRARCGAVDAQSTDAQIQQRAIENDVLRERVRNQQLACWSAQSVVSELLVRTEQWPIDTRIHLGTDWHARRATLVALKAQKLHDAQQLLAKRMQFMDPLREVVDDARFVAANGDFCSVAFENVCVPGAHGNVRQVFDALQFHTHNMERSIGSAMGTVFTSDGDALDNNTIVHRRLVHSTVRDVVVESNFAVFSAFYDAASCKRGEYTHDRMRGGNDRISSTERGVIVLDFIDDDELFPYRTSECLRRDVTGVIALRSVPSKASSTASSTVSNSSGDAATHTVVITKWLLLRLRHNSALGVSDSKMRELRAGIHHISDALVRAVQDSITLPAADNTNAAIV